MTNTTTSKILLSVTLFTLSISGLNAQNSTKTSIVYVETNALDNQNAVLAYRRDNGVLTFVKSYPTRGSGVVDPSLKLGPFDSDQDLVTNAEKTLLFAVNAGSNTIAVFNILPDGSLTHVPGSPFASGGSNPVSAGVARDTLVVINKAEDPNQGSSTPNYTSFRLTPDGQLSTMLTKMTVPTGASPTQALISAGNRLAFGADFLGGMLRSFLIQPDGSLQQTDVGPLPASESVDGTKPLPLGLWSHPHRPILYVGFVTVNKLGVYTYDSMGKLSFVRTVPNSGAAICWLRTNTEGTRLYTSNTGDNTISVYDTTEPLRPVEIQKLKLKDVGSAFQITVDPSGRWLYVVTQRATPDIPLGRGSTLHILEISLQNGTLTEERSPIQLPVPPAVRPRGVEAVQPISSN